MTDAEQINRDLREKVEKKCVHDLLEKSRVHGYSCLECDEYFYEDKLGMPENLHPNYLADAGYILGLQIKYMIDVNWIQIGKDKFKLLVEGIETDEPYRHAVALAAIKKEGIKDE
jgi:hypothetical protein